MQHSLNWIDGAVLLGYACAMLGVGWWYGRRQGSADEYFFGSRAMHPVLIGVSMFATLFSTISYLTVPGEILKHGPVISLTALLAIPLYYVVVGHVIAPLYMRRRAATAYELLEIHLGGATRTVGAAMFVLLRLMWMSVLIFFASQALLIILGLGDRWLPVVTLATGSVAISYSSMGGLRAVVVTDCLQFLLLFTGACLVIAVVTRDAGGLSWIPTRWSPIWDTQPFFSFDLTERVTVVGSLLQGVLWWVCTAGGDQTAIQRFMATRDAAAARRSFLINSLAGGAVTIVLVLVGFALLAFYQADSSRLPEGLTISGSADDLFPHFISEHLPPGLSGLVLCGLFAAAMSSVDSGVNSITAVVTSDFLERFRATPLAEADRVRAARWLAFGIGLTVVGASAFLMNRVPGNYLEQANRTFGLLVAPMFLLFVFALFIPFATQSGAIAGALAGFVAAFLVAYWEVLTGRGGISFQWIFPASLGAGVITGCLWSVATRRNHPAARP